MTQVPPHPLRGEVPRTSHWQRPRGAAQKSSARPWHNSTVVLLRRLKSLWLALAVAVLNAGLPVLAYAAMAGKGGLTQMICSPAGMQMIAVDADGKARQVETQPPHGGHCLLCAMPMALPVPSSTPPAPSTAACGALRVGQTCVHLDSAVTTPPATGPPALA